MNEIIQIGLNADPGNLIRGFAQADTAVGKFGASVKAVTTITAAAGQALDAVTAKVERFGRRTAAAGVAMSLSFAGMATAAGTFQRSMLNVQSIARLSEGDFNRLGQSIINMSRRLPQSAGVIAEGYYDIASSGFAGAEAMSVLEASTTAASAGLTDTAVSARAISAVLNAYGINAAEAADVSDILFKTVDLGVITFEEMAVTMGDWIGMAAQAKVGADEGAAAIAAMTLAGMSAPEAGTSLARMLQAFIDPSEQLSALVNQLGHESALAMVQTQGLEASVMEISSAVGGNVEAFVALFPEIRAARGIMALAANEGQNYTRVAGQITDANARAGATQRAFNIQMQGMAAQWQLFKNNLAAGAIEIGNKLVPALTMVLEGLNKLLGMFEKIPGPIKTAIAFLGLASAAVLTIGGAILAMAAHSIVWKFVMGRLALSATGLSGILGGRLAPAMTAVSAAAGRAAASNGILSASYHAVSASAKGAAAANSLASASAGGMIGMALAAGAAVWYLHAATNAAEKRGKEMAETFAEELDTSSVEGMTNAVNELSTELEIAQRNVENGRVWAIWSTQMTEDIAYAEELKSQLFALEIRAEATREALIGAFLIERNEMDLSDMYPDLDKVMPAFRDYQNEVGVTEDAVVMRMERIADAFDIDISQHPLTFVRQMSDAMDSMGNTTGNAESLAFQISELGTEAATTGDRISALGDILDTVLGDTFGYEAAVDNTQKSLNGLYQSVLDIKDAGTLSEAMDPGSFHEDALSLRSDMRGLTGDIIDQAVEWAGTQEDLTGGEFLKYLSDQADELREMGEAAGLSTEFIEHYAGAIEDASNLSAIGIAFNESDLEAFNQDTNEMLAHLAMTPDEVTVAAEIYKEDGEAALREFLETLNIVEDEDVEAVIKVNAREAYGEMITFAAQKGVLEEDIVTAIITSIENPEDLDALLADLAITEDDFEAIVSILGGKDSELAAEAVEARLEALTGEDWEPEVDVDESPALQALRAIETKMLQIDQMVATPTVSIGGLQGVPYTGGEALYPGTNNADGNFWESTVPYVGYRNGGYEKHEAQIASGNTIRIWAEPETGGEAYIPLSPGTKRKRATRILAKVAGRFGMMLVKQFAEGGINYDDLGDRFRDSDSSSGGGGGRSSGGSSTGSAGSSNNLDTLSAMFEHGDLEIGEYISKLEEAIKRYKKYSDDYMGIFNTLERLKDDQAADELRRQSIMLELNEISETSYLNYLNTRLAQEERYTDEWWNLYKERESIQENMNQRQQGVEKMLLETGLITEKEYKKILRNRMSDLRQFSEEWFSVWNELNSFNQEVVRVFEDAQRDYDDALQDHLDSQENYNRAVKDATERFRNEMEQELRSARTAVTGPIEALSDATRHFSGELVTNKDEILEYYRHVAEGAGRFRDSMARLENAGVNEGILQQLYEAGPEALNMATALEAMVQSGDITELNSLFGEIESISDETGDFYMRNRGKKIVDAFGIEESIDWMGDFGVSIDDVNFKANEMAMKFDGVKLAIEAMEAAGERAAETLSKLDTAEADKKKAEADTPTSPVEALYEELFGRKSDAGGLAYWTSLFSGGASIDAIREAMKNTPEYIKTLYKKLFDRPADSGGLAFWTAIMQTGVDGDTIEQMMKETPEYKNRKAHGGFLPGGRTGWVGESGPEMFTAPMGGALVYPSAHSGQASGGDTLTTGNITIGDNQSLTKRDVQDALAKAFKQARREKAVGRRN